MATILTLPVSPRSSPTDLIHRAIPFVNALSVDVEDYFHVSAFEGAIDPSSWDSLESRVGTNTERILDLLDEYQIRATFFVLGWVADRQPSLVKAIQSAGHEIGTHGYRHQLIYRQTPEEFRDDLRRSLNVLEDIVGEPIRLFRAPSFSITKDSMWALDILAEEGIMIDSSIYPTHHDRYGIPGVPLSPHQISTSHGPIWEFPPPVWKVMKYPLPVGGGGYFRLYPYQLSRFALRQINQSGRPFCAYIHPWEIDPDQPRVRVGLASRFRHYLNLHRTESRIKQLLSDFPFGTISDSLGITPGATELQKNGRLRKVA